jgi:diadenosine tetraphosphate (Ap4A) HIT family hydrolase
MLGNNFLLWEDAEFVIKTPFNPHIPYHEGLHLVVAPQREDMTSAWQDPAFAAMAFKLAAQACRTMDDAGVAPWFNIQANGNWGLLPGSSPFFHIHIYGRNKTESWGKPLVLPEAPKTYHNDPMPEPDRIRLAQLLANAMKASSSSHSP